MGTLFEIDRSDELGRFLVAKVDIPPRSLLIREKPLAAAPADDDRGSPGDRDEGQFPGQDAQESAENELYPHPDPDSTSPRDRQMRIPMCLGCFTRMTECPESRCSQCSWPVCHQRCSQLPHHSENECKLFTSNRTPYTPPHKWPVLYKSILVLRAYLLKFPEFSLKLNIPPEKDNGSKSESDSDYTELMKFEDHRDLRWKNPDLVKSDGMIVDNINYFFKNNSNNNNNDNIISGDYEINEDEILKISGIINVNAFTTLKEIEKNKVAIIQCLFKVSTLVSHSCCPNSTWFIGNAPFFRMSIHSAVLIKKGEMLTIPYSARENQYGTLQRLVSTEDVAHFTCGCHRCLDPTELGTMVSAVKCCSSSGSNSNNNDTSPCPGYLLPANPTDTSSVWKCTNQPNCQFSTPVQNIVRILCRVEAQLEKIKLNYERNQRENENGGGETRLIQQNSQFLAESEALKRKCDEILHPNHYLIQEICMTIVKKEATTAGISNLAGEQLTNFIKHCRFLLEIANVTGPGYCRHRAILQFYLSRGLHREAREAVEDFENEQDNSEKEEEKDENCDIKCVGIDLDLKHEKTANSYGNNDSDRLVSGSGSGINSKCYKILNIYKSIDDFEKESFLFFQMEDANNNSSDEDLQVQQVDTKETPLKINSSSVYLKKLAEQMELTKRRIDKFQNLITNL